MLLCAERAESEAMYLGECYGASESTERSDREWARIGSCEIRERQAKFESPESHRSDFGGERKPISNSDQIQSAQKWRLSIPPDSSRRDETQAPNRVKIRRRTHPMRRLKFRRVRSTRPTRAHVRQRKETMAAHTPHAPHALARGRYADYAPEKPRMRNEMNKKMIGQIRQCIGHEHDEMNAHGLWTKLKEMYREKTSQNKALMRRLVVKLQRGTIVAEQMSEFQRATGRGQKKRPEKRSQEGGHRGQEKRRDKKNCPRNKAQDQSSEAATTAMMAVDESDVLLAASADEESDWIFDSGIAYHLCRDREVFSTHVVCEGLVRMANDAIVGKGQSGSACFEASGGTLRVSKENRKCCKRRKTEGLYRLEGSVQTKGAVVRHRPSGTSEKNGRGKQPLHRSTQSKRGDIRRMYLKDPEWYRSVKRCFGIRVKVWPDTRRCNQCRMSMEKLRGERQSRCTATGATSPKRSLGTTIGIRAKFESPESHRSDFGGERKPISNSDQIQSAQKWRLSIPPDSSRRDETQAPNRVKIRRRTHPMRRLKFRRVRSTRPTRAHVRQRKETMAAHTPHAPHALARGRYADYAPEKPRMRNEMNKKMIGQIRQCIGHEHDEMNAHGLWTKLKEMYREKTSQNKALMRRLVVKLQRGTIVAEQMSEFQRATGRGQKKRPEKRSQEGGHRGQEKRRDKKNCPRNKAQDQSSEAATTVMMAVDESDVLLAASADEESDWIFDSGIAYHLCRDREVFSTHVVCEGLVRMANDAIVGKGQSGSACFEASGGTLRVSKENRKCCKRRKTEGLYRLEGSVQTKGAVVRHRPSGTSEKNGRGKQPLHRSTQSKRGDIRRMYLKDPEWYRSVKRCFGIRVKVWPDTRRCNQCRMSMEKLRGERQSRCTATGATLPKRVSFALDINDGDLSNCAHKGGEMESQRLAKRRTLQRTPVRGAGHLSEKVQALQFGSAFTLVGSGVAR
ncbi:hypothetical protein Acr_00g0053870 [Actinidia rufa]|uniref:Uncharacterized protein n=1 Tax=Actinidia rufa TaxID=165716 RepID=A0A7J0DLN6_9ERIC|nr:hypothetical protein Acr_00g0053870 [Actinidia rufa]